MFPSRAPRYRLALFLIAALLACGQMDVPVLRAQAAQDTASVDTQVTAGDTIPQNTSAASDTALGSVEANDTTTRDTAAAAATQGGRQRTSVWVPIALLVLAGVLAFTLFRLDDDGSLSGWGVAVLGIASLISLFAAGVAGGLWWSGRVDAGTGPAVRAGPAGPAAEVPAAAPWGLQEFLLLGLAVVSLVFLALFVVESRRHAVALESHWGGFGGGLGGLRVPASGLYLLVALAFSTMLTVLAVEYSKTQGEVKGPQTEKSRTEQADTTAEKAGTRPAAIPPDSTAAASAPADTSQS